MFLNLIPGRFGRAKLLLGRGGLVDIVDAKGQSPLHVAAKHGYEAMVGLFLVRLNAVISLNVTTKKLDKFLEF